MSLVRQARHAKLEAFLREKGRAARAERGAQPAKLTRPGSCARQGLVCVALRCAQLGSDTCILTARCCALLPLQSDIPIFRAAGPFFLAFLVGAEFWRDESTKALFGDFKGWLLFDSTTTISGRCIHLQSRHLFRYLTASESDSV